MVPKKPFFTLAFFTWMAFITYSSLTSFSGIDTGSFGFDIPHGDKLVHFVFYFTAVVLGIFFLQEQGKSGMKLTKALVLMFFITTVYGIIIEVFQYSFTTNREGDFFDAMANSLGSLLGVLTSNFLFSSKGFFDWPE